MRVYPVNMLIEGKRCAVIGGGDVAARKVAGLIEAGALVTVISPSITHELEEKSRGGEVQLVLRKYESSDLDGMTLAIAATNDADVNRKIVEDGRVKRVPINVADSPAECDFILPAIVRRGNITIAVGTGGSSPALARKIKQMLENAVWAEFGELAHILGKIRTRLVEQGKDLSRYRKSFEALIESDLLDCLRKRDYESAKTIIHNLFGDIKIDLEKKR